MTRAIELTDIGPIDRLTIPIPEDGGVVVLRGSNGSGKSSAIRAVDRLASGRAAALSARDGSPSGRISGCGVTVRVARSISRTGELECESLDGRLSVAELVDPGLKGAEEADGRRIRALVQLAGVEADPAMFAPLFDSDDDFEQVTKGADLKTDDVLILADRIKRAIDAAARGREGTAAQERSKADACRESAAGVSMLVETDEATLQVHFEIAARADQELRSRAAQAKSRNAEIEEARRKLLEINPPTKPGDRRVTAEEARQREKAARNTVADRQNDVTELERQLGVARHQLQLAESQWEAARNELETAERHEIQIKALSEIVTAKQIEEPTAEELQWTADDVSAARQAIEAGALARRALEQLQKAEEHRAREAEAARRAETLREAGRRVDDVLSGQIARLGVPLEVKAGRLMAQHPKRGLTPFAELSEGERWRLALDIAIEAVGPGGLLSIPQAAFEGLDPDNRRMISEHVKGRGVVILTAESSDGPIRAEVEP